MKDIMGLMKQAQAMQQKMADLQTELESVEVEGAAGGGMVKVTLTAKGAARAVSIDPSLMVADETEILEDLVLAAFNDARVKADRAAGERMAEITKGLPIPPGLKLF